LTLLDFLAATEYSDSPKVSLPPEICRKNVAGRNCSRIGEIY